MVRALLVTFPLFHTLATCFILGSATPDADPKATHGVAKATNSVVMATNDVAKATESVYPRQQRSLNDAYGPPQQHGGYYPAHPHPHPHHDPEPIIEIIIKDSNETLPAPPPVYSAPAPKPTKEPVQVFYVKYKKNPHSYGKEDDIIYEPPVPALTPPTNNEDLESHTPTHHTVAYTTPAPPLPPRPSTTLRTIIHPDSEIYHGTGGVKVTFGKTEIHPAPVISHREDSSPSFPSSPSNDHVTKRDSSAAGSSLQPVRRAPEYRSPILNQNEFQALPPDYNKGGFANGPGQYSGPGNDHNAPNNAIGDFSGPFKNGPNEFNGIRNGPPQGQNFDGRRPGSFDGINANGPVRNAPPSEPPGSRGQANFNGPPRPGSFDGPIRPNYEGPIRNGQNFAGPVRNGPPFDGPVRDGANGFNGPIRNGPAFDGPARPNYEGPVRNAPNNFNRPVETYTPQSNNNFGGNRPNTNTLTKVAFPGAAPPQTYLRQPEIQNQGPPSAYKQPNQPLQPQFQQPVRQDKPFVPSQPIYSSQELYQPPSPYQQNSYVAEQNKRPQQINGFQQAALKTPPMQQFNTYDAVRKPAPVPNYEQEFTKKPLYDQQYNQPSKTIYSPVKQSTEIASFEEPTNYAKASPSDSKFRQTIDSQKQSQQLYEQQKQQELERQQQAQLQQLQQQYYLLQQQSQQQSQYSKPSTQTESIPSSFLQQQSQYSKPSTQTESIPSSFLQQQQQQILYGKSPASNSYNVEQQNNLFVQNEHSLSSLKAGTELSNEEYKILLEKQRLAQVKLLQKDRDQIYLQEQQQQQQQEQQQQQQQIQQQQQEQALQLLRQQAQGQQQYQQRLQNHRPESSQQSELQAPNQVTKLSQYQTSKKTQNVYAKPTTTKYVSSTQPSVKYTSAATTAAPEASTEFTKEQKEKYNKNLLALPDEVPDDIRQQLLSSGILGNADIQILDYDKVGDIPIENLPPEALANFYGGGGAAQKRSSEITKRSAQSDAASAPADQSRAPVEMKVVKFNPDTVEGQQLAQSYIQGQQGGLQGQTSDVTLDPVVLNDASYNRYLPLKVDGASFPIPDSELLVNRRITSVVVLAPVDYETIVADDSRPVTGAPEHVTTTGFAETHDHRDGKAIKVAGVHFVSGNILNDLIKTPTEANFKNWLRAEKQFPVNKQSILLLVATPGNSSQSSPEKQVFMYDFNSENISELKGDLSETFLQVAESNASSEDLENVSQEEGPTSKGAGPRSPGTNEPTRELTKRGEKEEAVVTSGNVSSSAKDVIKRESS